MGRSKKYIPRAFESTGVSNDTSANIYESMLQSEAFKNLATKQQMLYVCMKSQYYGKRKPRQDYRDIKELQDDSVFYFSISTAEKYGLYTRSNSGRLYKDIDVLVSHGFIEVISKGKNQHEKTIYKFSGRWKMWNDSS